MAIQQNEAADLYFYVNGADSLHIKSNGKVGIGTSSPAQLLDVEAAVGGDYIAHFRNGTSATPYTVFIEEPNSAGAGYPLLNITTNGSATEWFRVDSARGVTQLKMHSGAGIDFSATADATGHSSSLLADYEEGSWTPALANGGSATVYSCRYTKIGREVTIHAYAYYSSTPNDSNDFQINGLPFTVSNDTSNMAGGFMLYGGSFNVTTIAPFASNNTTSIRFYAIDGGGGGGVKVNSSFYGTGPAATRYLNFKLIYYTD